MVGIWMAVSVTTNIMNGIDVEEDLRVCLGKNFLILHFSMKLN